MDYGTKSGKSLSLGIPMAPQGKIQGQPKAESGYLLYYPHFAGICQAGSDGFVSCLFPIFL